MTREDFYHSRPMTFLQRLVSIEYGSCGGCDIMQDISGCKR